MRTTTPVRSKLLKAHVSAIALLGVVTLTACGGHKGQQSSSTAATSQIVQEPVPVCAVPGECAPQVASSDFGRMIAMAVYMSPEVTQARADLSAARAALGTARAGGRPQFGAQAESENLTFSVRQPIWAGGKIRANAAEAAAAVRQAEASYAAVQLDMAARIIDAAGRWAEAYAAVGALESTVADYADTANILNARIAAGFSGASEAELMAARRATIEADLMSARANRDLARAQLDTLTGSVVNDLVLFDAILAASGPSPNSRSINDVIAEHPAIEVADATIERATARLASVRADRFPVLSLVAETRMIGAGVSGTDQTSRVFLGFTTNLGPGVSLSTRRAEAEQQLEAQRAARAVRARSIGDEVVALDLRHKAAQARISSNSRAIAATASVVESYKSQITTTGSRSWQDLLGAVRDLGDARRARAASEAELLVSYWRLKAMTGGIDGL